MIPPGVAVIAGAWLLVSPEVHPWAGYAVSACAALLLCVVLWQRPWALKLPGRLPAWGIGLYFGAAALSVPFSTAPWISLRHLLLHMGLLFLFLLVLALEKRGLLYIAVSMTAAGSLSAAFALRQRLGGFQATLESGMAGPFAKGVLQEGRVFGLTFSPDMLAAIMAALIPVGLSLMNKGARADTGKRRGIIEAALPAIAVALFIAALALTRSLGGWLAAGAGVIAWLCFARLGLERRGRQALVAGAATVLVAGAAAIIFMRGGHLFKLEDRDNPALRRMDNFRTGLELFAEFPLTGAGAGNYGAAALHHRSVHGNEAQHAHNAFIEALAETGPVGLLGLALIYASFFRRASRLFKPREDDADYLNNISPGFAAAGTAVLLHSLIDYDWYVMEVAVLFWVSWAALLKYREQPRRKTGSKALRGAALASLAVTSLGMAHQAGRAVLAQKADRAARVGRWGAAREYASRALKWDRTSDRMHGLYARAIMMRPESGLDAAKARESLMKAVSLNPRYPYYFRDLGYLFMREDPEDAGRYFEMAVQVYPNSLDLNVALGRWLREMKRFQEAGEVLSHAIRCSAHNSEALFEMALLKLTQGMEEEAEAYFQEAIGKMPYREAHAVAYARFLAERGKDERAASVLREWISRHPKSESAIKELELLRPRAN